MLKEERQQRDRMRDAKRVRRRMQLTMQTGEARTLPRLRVPTGHTVGQHGRWELCRTPSHCLGNNQGRHGRLERGYWSGVGWEPTYLSLKLKGVPWMSMSLRERQSQAVQLKFARGNVVMCGVGLGLLLYNLCLKPEVLSVIAVDRDADIINMVKRASRKWDHVDKIKWVHGDALDLERSILSRISGVQAVPHYLCVDIWKDLGADEAVADVQKIQSIVLARSVGWWGQEVDFVDWCMREHIPRERVDLDAFDRWCLSMDMCVHERSAEYINYCFVVAENLVDM